MYSNSSMYGNILSQQSRFSVTFYLWTLASIAILLKHLRFCKDIQSTNTLYKQYTYWKTSIAQIARDHKITSSLKLPFLKLLYTALNSPSFIFALKRSVTDSPSLEFAQPPILCNIHVIQLAQFWIHPQFWG